MTTVDVSLLEEVGGETTSGEIEETRTRRRRPPLSGVVALGYLVALTAVAILAPVVAPHNPNAINVLQEFQRPGFGTHLLGTDEFGRDELSRLIYGARVSLIAAAIGTSVALVVGAPLGMLAGYMSGGVEAVSNFFFDALMSMPAVIFALAVLAVLGPGLVHAMFAIGIVISPVFFRLARSATIDVRQDTFVEASVAMGCSRARTVWRHVVPNSLTPIVVQSAVIAGVCIVAEAGISFLGFGVQPPTASWGSMLTTAQQNMSTDPWLLYLPGIAIAVTVLAFSLLGDWLRAVLGAKRRPGSA